jgi:hypothetical protein
MILGEESCEAKAHWIVVTVFILILSCSLRAVSCVLLHFYIK